MKKVLFFSAIVLITMAFETGKTSPREKHRIKVAINRLDNDTLRYFYKSDGYVSRIQDSKGDNVSYEYLNKRIFRKYFDAVKALSFTDTLLLNSDGLVDGLSSNNIVIITERREFNSDKCMTRTKLYNKHGDLSGTAVYVYENGNLSSDTTIVKSGGEIEVNNYQYDMSHSNTIGDDNTGEGFIGADSKNPLKSSMTKLMNLEPTYYNYHYQYHNDGRIVVEAVYDTKSGKVTDSLTYSYY